MGSVTLVWDAERQEEVALKRLFSGRSRDLVRFKLEFRRVEQLLHPALVRLYELGEDDGGLYFTMEAIDGVDLRAWCRRHWIDAHHDTLVRAATLPTPPSEVTHRGARGATSTVRSVVATETAPIVGSEVGAGALDVGRLASVLPSVIEGIAFLHSHGLVHRDLKPSNVMVDRAGRAKLLDFGVLAELGRRPRELGGTLAYMAPEQAREGPASPASDLYALGVTLFELAAGRLPFLESVPEAMLFAHMQRPPPRLDEAWPEAPPALVEAIARLLAKSPADRPSLEQLTTTLVPSLGGNEGTPSVPPPEPMRELVGRGAILARLSEELEAARRGSFRGLVLTGATGVGKSALIEHVATEASERGVMVLRGRARATERVPFNAIDGVADELALWLHDHPRADLQDLAEIAAAAFPVLSPIDAPRSPQGRGSAFEAVVSLLSRVATDQGLVLCIDDLQWADADSLALLDQVCGQSPARVLLVATLRDDVDSPEVARWQAKASNVHAVLVPPLGTDDILAILAHEVRGAARRADTALLEDAARRCHGRPFFAEVLGRSLGRSTAASADAVLREIVGDLAPEQRDVAAALGAADGWVLDREIASVLHRRPGEVQDALRELAAAGIVRRSGWGGDERADLYHDVVRQAALAALGGDALREAHTRFAEWLETGEAPEPLRLVRHLEAAGRERDASVAARDAARKAVRRHAHGLGAKLFRLAARHLPEERVALLAASAAASGRAGRYADQAAAWAEVGRLAPERAIEVAFREAEALLASNVPGDGVERLNRALAAAGDPYRVSQPLRDAASVARYLLGPRRRRAARGRRASERADRDLQVGLAVAFHAPITGMRFLQRAQSDFLDAGNREEAAFCDLIFAYLTYLTRPERGLVPLAERYRTAAHERLNGPPNRPEVLVASQLLDGVRAMREARWSEAASALDVATAAKERIGESGTYTHLLALSHRAAVDIYGERYEQLDASVDRYVAAARDTDRSVMGTQAEMVRALQLFVRGRIEEALAMARAAASKIADGAPSFLRLMATASTMQAALLVSDGVAEKREVDAALARAGRRGLRSAYAGMVLANAALAEALALRSGDPTASLARVERYVADLDRMPPLGGTRGLRALAYAHDAVGHPEQAIALLERAEREAATLGLRGSLAVARYQRGLRLAGDEGGALVEEARRVTRALAIEHILAEDVGHR